MEDKRRLMKDFDEDLCLTACCRGNGGDDGDRTRDLQIDNLTF